jgi:hypothetical protein
MNIARLLTAAAVLLLSGASGAALAAEQPVAVVHSASAGYSPTSRHTIIVRATVDLPNSCWSNPRFQHPARGVEPDADGVVPITVVADSSEGAGVMCSMIFRPAVHVPALHWTTYPAKGLKAVRVIGSTTPIVATVARSGAPGS